MSVGMASTHYMDDELIFGDYCLNCGNVTSSGTSYCSSECCAGLEAASPSGSNSSVPLLEGSTKSNTSSPSSSLASSPVLAGGDAATEVPILDLSASKFYGASSLPRYPLTYAISYANDDVKVRTSRSMGKVSDSVLDLKFRRRVGILPTQIVPAPLYFRQSAAAIHPPPPVSPIISSTHHHSSPRFSPVRNGSSSKPMAPAAFNLPSPTAAPTLPRLNTDSAAVTSTTSRRLSFPTQLNLGIAAIKADLKRSSLDAFISPRIRALRHGDSPIGIDVVEEGTEEPEEEGGVSTGKSISAFSSYLFSHLVTGDPSDEEIANGRRGRTSQVVAMKVVESRSTSHDTVFTGRGATSSKMKRASFGSHFGSHSRTTSHGEEGKIVGLTPGKFISATASSSTPTSSTMSSPIPSPPTLVGADNALGLATMRGRSNLRNYGGILRSLSPTRDSSQSNSRSRQVSSSSSFSAKEGRGGRQSSVRGEGDRDRVEAEEQVVVEEEVEVQRERRRIGGRRVNREDDEE